MKDITNIKKVSLTYKELMECNIVDTNRCGYLTKDEALNNGFSEMDWNKFVSRANKIKNIIKKKGFSNASFFILAKDEEGKIYILDGQGRRMALKLLESDNSFNFTNAEFVCDLYTEPMSTTEMAKLIIDLNTGNTNWQNKDIRRSNALASDDEKVREAYKYTKSLIDKYEMTDYVAHLLTYGEKASHQQSNSIQLSTDNYATTKDVFTEAYLKLICNLSVEKDKNGNDVPRPKDVQKKIRNVTFAISFNSCLRQIVKKHNGNIDEAKDDIMKFTDIVIEAGSGDNRFVKQFMHCDKKDQRVVADKVRRYIRTNSLREALYVTA